MLVTSDADGGSYELHLLPKDAGRGEAVSVRAPRQPVSLTRCLGLFSGFPGVPFVRRARRGIRRCVILTYLIMTGRPVRGWRHSKAKPEAP